MFGKMVYQGEDGYAEYLLADENSVMVKACIQGSQVKLYRVEWLDRGGYDCNTAVYSLPDAIALFGEKTQQAVPLSERGVLNGGPGFSSARDERRRSGPALRRLL